MPLSDPAKYGLTPEQVNGAPVNSRMSQRWPDTLGGQHTEAVVGFRFVPGTKENGGYTYYQAKLKLLSSDQAQYVGRTYAVSFFLSQDPKYVESDIDKVKQFAAACMGSKGDDPAFNFFKALQTLIDCDDTNGFADEECQVIHQSTTRPKKGFDKKTGAALTGNNVYHDFAPVT